MARQAVRLELGLQGGAAAGGLVELATYFRLAREHAAVSLEESLGLAPRPLVSGTTDFVMAQAAVGETLQDAMRFIAIAYNKLHGGQYNFVESTSKICAFRVDDAAFPYTRPADASVTLMLECVLIYLHSAFCVIAGEDLTPAVRRVSTRRPKRAEHDPLAFWQCPIQYGAPVYAIEYDARVAKLPVTRVRLSEAVVHNRILSLIEHRERALFRQAAFTTLVRQALRDGARNQGDTAQRLGCSAATLRRKLTDEGQSFRALRRQHLNEAARLKLLRVERIADVADTLGFSDCRSFTRAFKGWNGQSPQAYRNAQKSAR